MSSREQSTSSNPKQSDWTVFVLAGGRSKRMGRDKAQIQIRGISLLNRIKKTVALGGLPVRTIRTDAIKNCGPLSGIYTGLLRARTRWCLFLGCDMPLIRCETLKDVISKTEKTGQPVFTQTEHGFGFPLSLSTDHLDQITALIREGKRSIFQLARMLNPAVYEIPGKREMELFNVNTPDELEKIFAMINQPEA